MPTFYALPLVGVDRRLVISDLSSMILSSSVPGSAYHCAFLPKASLLRSQIPYKQRDFRGPQYRVCFSVSFELAPDPLSLALPARPAGYLLFVHVFTTFNAFIFMKCHIP